MGKRLLTLVLDAEKLRNFQLPSKDRASVDALWMCMHLSEGGGIIIKFYGASSFLLQ